WRGAWASALAIFAKRDMRGDLSLSGCLPFIVTCMQGKLCIADRRPHHVAGKCAVIDAELPWGRADEMRGGAGDGQRSVRPIDGHHRPERFGIRRGVLDER